MRRVEGTKGLALIECANPVQNKWRVRWDVQPAEGENAVTYIEVEFSHKPALDEIKQVVTDHYNDLTKTKILSGFKYEGNTVWLSAENQFNYKAAYDLALQSAGQSLPVTFKFYADDNPVYREFESVDELQKFYMDVMKHVQNALQEGWRQKDNFDMNVYL